MNDTIPEVADSGFDDQDPGSATGAVPGYYWAVAVVGLLWNCIGVYFYMVAKLDPQALQAGMPPTMQDYVANMPLWAHVGWSLGIWGSFAGSVLLLLRRRHAVTAFMLSLIGAVASFAAQAMADVLTPAEPVMVLTVIGFLAWFAQRARRKGQLG